MQTKIRTGGTTGIEPAQVLINYAKEIRLVGLNPKEFYMNELREKELRL